MNTRKILNFGMAVIFALSLLAMPAGAAAQEPPLNPIISAGPNQGFVYGFGWMAGALVHLTVVRSGTVVYQADATVGPCGAGNPGLGPCGPNDVYFEMGPTTSGLLVGDLITLQGGGITRSMTVSCVQAMGIDISTGTLSGIANPDQPVYMIPGSPGNPQEITAIPDADGYWSVVLGPQYTQYDMGGVKQCDGNGNCTTQAWAVPKPYIMVSPSSHWIQAREWDWPPIVDWSLGTELTLAIDDPTNGIGVDYTATAIMEHNPRNLGDPNDIRANFSWPNIGLQPGFIVTISGNNASKTLIVSPLQVDNIDVQANTIAGTTTPGANIDVCVNIPNNCIMRHVTADNSGNWLANYHISGTQPDEQQTVDLKAGSNGWAEESDSDRDITHADWRVPNPYIEASPTNNWVHAREWPLGTLITMTISGSSQTYTATMGPTPWNPGDPNDIVADFDLQGYDVNAGDVITATGNGVTKILVVSTLEVTDFELDNDLISGKGTTGMEIQVCAKVPGRCIKRWVVPTSLGGWTADYHDPGTGNDDPDTFDIRPGSNGWVAERDQDGDQTWLGWRVPNPNFVVRANLDQVEALEWALGETLALSIDNPNSTENPDYTTTKTVQGIAPWDLSRTYVSFDLGGIYDIKPGDQVSISNGTIIKITVVTNLAFTEFDVDADTVSGTAASGSRVDLWACDYNSNCVNRHANVDQNGNWLADFAHPGIEDDEQNTFDIVGGTWVDSQQNDGDGDGTSFGQNVPNVPNPRFNVDLEENKIYGIEWPDGTPVTLTIDNPATLQNPDFTSAQIAHVNSQARYQADVTFDPGNLKLEPGMLVTMTDSTTVKNHTIPRFDWTAIDYVADVVSGTAEPEMDTYVWVGEVARGFLPEADGSWIASFAIPGDESWETILDILPGMSGGMAQVDSDGDGTIIRWTDISLALNHPPVVSTLTAPINPLQLGQSINATVTFSDPDVGDTHTVKWDWGDGTTTTAIAFVPSMTTPHTYPSPGVYTITATVTDAAGASASATYQYVVIYDPNGGYVTGGGWIMSPAGAYLANLTLTGKATFGFVSKYQKGANIPTGNTEFQFHVANMNFKSTLYDWLVIAGTKAQYKGTGTINGSGNYGFMIAAADDTSDTFRIKIWDKASNQVIYDNQLGAADTDDPVTVIGGGSIVIHKEK